MLRWSLLCVVDNIAYATLNLLAFSIEAVCPMTTSIAIFIQSCAFVWFNFYQLAQIHYCFSRNSSTLTATHGYPVWLFIVLFAWGNVIKIIHILMGYLKKSDCHLTQEIDNNSYFIVLIVENIMYFLWDLIIILLYFNKLNKFNNYTNDKNKECIKRRISFILHKILFVNIGYNIIHAMNTAITFIRFRFTDEWLIPFHHGISALTMIVLVYFTYIVMEHNRDQYLKLLRFFRKFLNFCCFKKMVENASPFLEELADDTQTDGKNSGDIHVHSPQETHQEESPNERSMDTNTKSQSTPSQIELEIMSEYTQTTQ